MKCKSQIRKLIRIIDFVANSDENLPSLNNKNHKKNISKKFDRLIAKRK